MFAETVKQVVRLLMIAGVILLMSRVTSRAEENPADPFVGVSPSFNTLASKPAEYNVGEWGVA